MGSRKYNQVFKNAQAILIAGEINPGEIIESLKVAVGDSEVLEGEDLKIADLRGLIRWLNLKPLSDGIKLVVIKNADQIAAEASNTLLKTLEEPPSYAKIILTTLDEQKILPTIHSRCQKIRILADPKKQLTEEYLSPDELLGMPIKQKFEAAAKMAELPPDAIIDILASWQLHFRQMLLSGQDQIAILKEISRAKDLLQTNISVKLLLENLVLKM